MVGGNVRATTPVNWEWGKGKEDEWLPEEKPIIPSYSPVINQTEVAAIELYLQ